MAGTSGAQYLLGGNAGEIERLQLQARVWEPAARRLLAAIGVGTGWRCVDLGCGALGIVDLLSELGGATGSVAGVDNDPMQLAAIRAWVAAHGARNVTIVEGDAYATTLPRAAFDLVHARFVLAPGGRGDALLREMMALARPGGVVALEEPDAASAGCYPACPAGDTLKAAIAEAFRQGGGDFDAGRRVYGMLRAAGLADVQVRAEVLALAPGHPYRRVPVQFATILRPRIVGAGILSEAALDAAVREFERVAADDETVITTFTVQQAWGRKPGGAARH